MVSLSTDFDAEMFGNGAFFDSKNLWNFSLSSDSKRPPHPHATQKIQIFSNAASSIAPGYSAKGKRTAVRRLRSWLIMIIGWTCITALKSFWIIKNMSVF